MTSIDFYLIGNNSANKNDTLACRLTNKAFRLGHQVYLHTHEERQTRYIDQLLWTFQAGSFIPHAVSNEQTDEPLPVLIGHQAPPVAFGQVLINLNPEVPPFFSQFERVVDIVSNDEEQKQLARQRFRYYRDRGYTLNTHNL